MFFEKIFLMNGSSITVKYHIKYEIPKLMKLFDNSNTTSKRTKGSNLFTK